MASDLSYAAQRRFPRPLPRKGLRAYRHGTNTRYDRTAVFKCSNDVSYPIRFEHEVMRQVITCRNSAGESFRVTLLMA